MGFKFIFTEATALFLFVLEFRVSAAYVTVNYSQGHNGEKGQVQTGLGTNTLDISKHRWEGWPGKGQAGAQLPVGTESEVPTSRAEPASVPCRNPGNSLLFPGRAAVPARPVLSRLGRQCTPWSPPSSLQDVHPPRSRALRPYGQIFVPHLALKAFGNR